MGGSEFEEFCYRGQERKSAEAPQGWAPPDPCRAGFVSLRVGGPHGLVPDSCLTRQKQLVAGQRAEGCLHKVTTLPWICVYGDIMHGCFLADPGERASLLSLKVQ